ncbi:MAG: heat-inducible transcriptional repressor HrcA [Endomicrobium sp.]|jgi:heat-inducible transcriptional repressor|nr:heat-inducible transcriptional repressor HrcA [Endomicrobium sp.]
MRQVALEVLHERKAKILNAVIHHFIKTGKPVGSNVLIEEYGIKFSPATVRNLMAELEEEGFLTQPHTSAGRVPTDKGYRSYVDSLVNLQKFAIEEEERIRKEYERKSKEIESLLSETSKILSGLSQYTGFVLAPKAEYNEIINVELVQIAPEQLLIVLLTHTGILKHRNIKASLGQDELARLRIFLNRSLRGVPLAEANARIVSEIRKFQENERKMYEIAEQISDVLFGIQDDLYMGGTLNTMSVPEFNDFEPIKSIIKLNEDKEKLIKIINNDFNSKGINVKIGSENLPEELKELSIITTAYSDGDKAVGVLGIIGPKRMPYDRMMSLVGAVSRLLNDFFKKGQ